MSETNASWHADPTGRHDHRYWDGTQWTEHVADAGVAGLDPLAAPAPVAEVQQPMEPEPVGYTDEAPLAAEPAAAEEPAPAEEPLPTEEPVPVDQPAFGSEPAFSDDTVVDQEPVTPEVTESYPAVTDEPAAWPTAAMLGAPEPPPPYVPGDPDSPSTDESKKRLLIGGGILAAIILIAIAFFAFGDDDGGSPSAQDKISDSTDVTGKDGSDTSDTTDPPLDGSYGSDPELDALYDSCADGDFAACDELYSASPSGSEYQSFGDTCGDRNEPGGYCVDIHGDDGGGGDDGSSDTGGDGTAPADLEDNLADSFESTLGLSREKAECLAGKVSDAVDEGTISPEDATAGFIQYLSDCDISLEEIGAN